MNRLKRAFLSAGFVFAAMFNKPRAAEKMLLTLTQDQFAPDDAAERKKWEEWHPLERSWSKPEWIGKPRPSLSTLMRQNLNKEVFRRAKQKGLIPNDRVPDAE